MGKKNIHPILAAVFMKRSPENLEGWILTAAKCLPDEE